MEKALAGSRRCVILFRLSDTEKLELLKAYRRDPDARTLSDYIREAVLAKARKRKES
jgi:hypothetical protein